MLVSCQMATSDLSPKSSSGWSMSTLTCTLSVWQGQLAGNGTMELDSKTGAEYLKTYDTRKNTKSNHQVLRKGLFRGRQVLTGILETHENGDWNLRHSCQFWIPGDRGEQSQLLNAHIKMTVRSCRNEESKVCCKVKIKCQFKAWGLPCHAERRQKLKHWGIKSLWKWSFRLASYSAPVRLFSVHGIKAQCSAWGGRMQWTWT